MRTNELHARQVPTYTRIHPAREVAAGDAECRVASTDRSYRQSRPNVGNTGVIPSDTEVQRQVLGDLVIILHESAEFVLDDLRDNERACPEVRPLGQVVGIGNEIEVRDVA